MTLEARKAAEAKTKAVRLLERQGWTTIDAERFVEALVASR